ncbi:MAG: ATP-binding protein, partial [Clostridia bacterium]|nr:ATP-binding protein [Clostridia bacterium]
MGKINILGFDVANMIAAGEVVDRPASVVKELLENALDAGGDAITVEIRRGGVSFIRVSDNGCGMDTEDLPVALLRHATSKIKEAEDLDGISTLGFRGEALAAISAVSKIKIYSKVPGAPLGALLEAAGGEIVSIIDTGCADGTTVIVEDLFYNVPARRKFLKKDSTEAIAISAVVEKIALSRSDVSIKYISDGEVKFMTSGKGELSETVWALYGRDIAKRSLKVDREEGGIRVSGFV